MVVIHFTVYVWKVIQKPSQLLTDILFDCDSYKKYNVYHISLSFLFLNDHSENVQKKNFHLI
jgi:hypothetical protein